MPRAIDVHVHPPTKEYLAGSGGPYFANAFGVAERSEAINALVEKFTGAGVERAVLLAWDAETHTTQPATSNEFVQRLCEEHPDFFIGFGSIDPWKGPHAVREVARFPDHYGFRGVKLHPPAQGFSPADPRFFPLWDRIEREQLVVLLHAGHTGFGAGLPGAGGITLSEARPMPDIEAMATAFPDLQIICAHPGFPWHDDLLALAMHNANIYIDLSGWAPKYIPRSVIQHAKSLLQDKVMFGTDYPVIEPGRWISELGDLGFKEDVIDKILYRNAARLLKLEPVNA